MSINTELFDLVRSLDKQEKRYFQLFAARRSIKGRNSCVLLFNAIAAQQKYDEKAVREQLKGENFIKYLGPVKNQLHSLILKSLTAYHSAENSEAVLKNLLQQAWILYRKGLMKQSQKLLNKVMRLAERYEKHFILLEAYSLRYGLMAATKNAALIEKELGPLIGKAKEVLQELRLSFDYRQLQSEALLLTWTEKSMRSPAARKKIKKIEAKVAALRKPRSVSNSLFISNALTIFSDVKGDHAKAIRQREQIVEMIEGRPGLIEDNAVPYYTSLYNAAVYLHNLGYIGKALAYTEKLVSAAGKHIGKADHRKYYLMGTMVRMVTLSRNAGSSDAVQQIGEAEQIFAKWQKEFTLHDQVIVWYNFALFWFARGNLQTALKWINEVLNTRGTEKANPQTFLFVKIFNLVVRFEAGDADYMEYLLRSTYRFLLRRKRIYRFEGTLLSFIRTKAPRLNSRKELQQGLLELKTEMETLKKDPREAEMFSTFDYLEWLERKLVALGTAP